jgi:hypothetical protein
MLMNELHVDMSIYGVIRSVADALILIGLININ